MATAQPDIFAAMGKNQWYLHLSRTDGADLDQIKSVIRDVRAHCASEGHQPRGRLRSDPARRSDQRHARRLPALRDDRVG